MRHPRVWPIRGALQAYAEAVLTYESPNGTGPAVLALVDKKTNELLRLASDPVITREAGAALHNNLLRTVLANPRSAL